MTTFEFRHACFHGKCYHFVGFDHRTCSLIALRNCCDLMVVKYFRGFFKVDLENILLGYVGYNGICNYIHDELTISI